MRAKTLQPAHASEGFLASETELEGGNNSSVQVADQREKELGKRGEGQEEKER